MLNFVEPPSEMFDYWGIELPGSFLVPPPETELSFVLGHRSSYAGEFEVKYGDVIYGFVNGKIVIVCEVVDMIALPETQVVITVEEIPCYLTTVRARVMPLRPEILYRPGLLTEDGEPMSEEIEKAQIDAKQWGLPQLGGVGWFWDLGLGNDIFSILDHDAVKHQPHLLPCIPTGYPASAWPVRLPARSPRSRARSRARFRMNCPGCRFRR